jgi:hypothetical protein
VEAKGEGEGMILNKHNPEHADYYRQVKEYEGDESHGDDYYDNKLIVVALEKDRVIGYLKADMILKVANIAITTIVSSTNRSLGAELEDELKKYAALIDEVLYDLSKKGALTLRWI